MHEKKWEGNIKKLPEDLQHNLEDAGTDKVEYFTNEIAKAKSGLLEKLPKELQQNIISVLQHSLEDAGTDKVEYFTNAIAEAKSGFLKVQFTSQSREPGWNWTIWWRWCLSVEPLEDEPEKFWAKGSPEEPWKWEKIFK